MGNPLLDISATVKPELLTKHNLKSNDAILTEEENIFNDLKDGYQVDKPILSPVLPLQSSHQSPSFAILSPVFPLQSSHQSFLCNPLTSPSFAIILPVLPLQSSHQSFLCNHLTSLLPLQSSHQSPSFAIILPVLPLQSSYQSFLCVELAVCFIFSDPVNCM